MSEEPYPSGPWVGFYNYRPGDRHRMDLNLTFARGFIAGDGNDDVGRFFIKGRYEETTRECHWTKSYVGAHDVFYRGFREGKGIWGTWEITIRYHGGFHIWPREAGEGKSETESAEQVQPVDAIGTPVGVPLEGKTLSRVSQSVFQAPTPVISLNKKHALSPLGALVIGCLTTLSCYNCPAADWPQFRGPNCSGVASHATPPLQISPTNGVLWTAAVPWSPSSPCVNGDRIFLTTFGDGQLQTRCYAANTGRLIWSDGVTPEKLELFHNTEGSPSAATPACDDRHVVSYFGSFGLIAYDFQGKELWRHPLPVAVSGGSFGSGTSPLIVGNRVLLIRDQDQNSSLLAFDAATGKTIWESARPDSHGSFGTPILWHNNGVDEIICPGSIRLKGYDLNTGHERWAVDGLPGLACTTPVTGGGMLFFAGWSPGKGDSPRPTWQSLLQKYDKNNDGEITLDEVDTPTRDYLRGMDVNHDGRITKGDYDLVAANDAKASNVLVAINPGGTGDISDTHIAWKATRGLPYVPSPLFYQDRVYLLRDGGMMSSFDAKTGKVFYLQERLEAAEKYYASPVAADGRIYVVSVPGKLTVVKAGGEKPEILHQADFGERVFATPAIVGSRLFLRTQTKLYAFGK